MKKATDIFQLFKEALSGKHQDFTQGNISRAVVLLAIPMILELSLESVFALVDIFFVGKLGENAIATVGLTESVITIIYSIGIGLSVAAGAVVARRTGEKNAEAASLAGAQTMILALSITLILSLAGMIFAADILQLMGAAPDVVKDGSIFTRIMLGGSGVIIFLFIINGIFRGAGDAAMAMRSLWIASAINIILCPVMIHFFGLKGAAIATVTGRGSGVLYQCYHLFKGDGLLKMKLSYFKLDFSVINAIVKIASPATLQFLIASGSWVILAKLVADSGGTSASAGYQIAIRNVIFFILPAWGLSNAAATLVGQNLGAGNTERAEKSAMITARYNAIFMSFVTLLFILSARYIIRFFSDDETVVGFGAQALQIIGTGYIFYGIGMVMAQTLNGAGDTRTPTIINFFCFWIFQVPFAYLLAEGLNMKATGAFISIPVSQTMIALISLYYFKKGKWKSVRV